MKKSVESFVIIWCSLWEEYTSSKDGNAPPPICFAQLWPTEYGKPDMQDLCKKKVKRIYLFKVPKVSICMASGYHP